MLLINARQQYFFRTLTNIPKALCDTVHLCVPCMWLSGGKHCNKDLLASTVNKCMFNDLAGAISALTAELATTPRVASGFPGLPCNKQQDL